MSNELNTEIEEAIAASARVFDRQEVVKIIRSVMETIDSDNPVTKIYDQLDGLAQYIENARHEIAQTNPDEINNKHIPTATDELDAVVGATEEATGSIMDACDAISDVAANLDGEAQEQITDHITKIYEACSFQDITGQRITKVVKALQHIESKVGEILNALGDEVGAVSRTETVEEEKSEDEKLLNGPALPDSGGIDQDEIDRLLAEFD